MAKKKRKYTKRNEEFWGADKSMSAPPRNKAILEPIKMRQCDYCLTKTDSVYCPNCGKQGDDIIQKIGEFEKELAIDGVIEVGVYHYKCIICKIDFWIAYGK